MDKKKKRTYSRPPDTQTFEEFKSWFFAFGKALGAKESSSDPITDERLREVYEKLNRVKKSAEDGGEKM